MNTSSAPQHRSIPPTSWNLGQIDPVSAVTPARSTRAFSTCSFSSVSLAMFRNSNVARNSLRLATVDFLNTFGLLFSDASSRSSM